MNPNDLIKIDILDFASKAQKSRPVTFSEYSQAMQQSFFNGRLNGQIDALRTAANILECCTKIKDARTKVNEFLKILEKGKENGQEKKQSPKCPPES